MTYSTLKSEDLFRRAGLMGVEERFSRSFDSPCWTSSASGSASASVQADAVVLDTSIVDGDTARLRGWHNTNAYERGYFLAHFIASKTLNTAQTTGSQLRLGWDTENSGGAYYDLQNAEFYSNGTTTSTDVPGNNTNFHILILFDVEAGETTFKKFGNSVTDETVVISSVNRPSEGTVCYYESEGDTAENYGLNIHYARLVGFDPEVAEINI